MGRIGNLWMHSTFEAIIIGKKLTPSTGNTVEIINFLDSIFDGAIEGNSRESDRPPSTNKANWY